jgi:hypothetical protein
MKITKSIQRWGSWLLMSQFRLHEFNALFAVEDPEGLAALLAQDPDGIAYGRTRALHTLRWMLFDPRYPGEVAKIGEPRALLLSLVCDGSVRGALESLLDHAEPRTREILEHCRGFKSRGETPADTIAYLKDHEIKSRYMFRDLGPLFFAAADPPPPGGTPVAPVAAEGDLRAILANLLTALRLAFQQAPDAQPDPTMFEIEDAFDTRDRFLRFFAESAQHSASELRRRFLNDFGQDGFRHPLTRFERRLPHEQSWTRRIIDTSLKVQDESARRVPDRRVRRAIHAKGHGSIHAKFKVLGNEHGVGLFSVKRTYDAVLRPSNGSGLLQPDRKNDGRGLALRVLVPPGTKMGDGQPPKFLESPPGVAGGYQDFVLMSKSVFFAPDVRRLAEWFRVLELDDKRLASLAMLLVPGGLRQTWLIARTRANAIHHPFATSYHSASSYQYGDDCIAQYSIVAKDAQRFRRGGKQKDPDFLKEALQQSLREGPIVLQFFVHLLRTDAPLHKRQLTIQDVVEDAMLDWNELDASSAHVADIEIAKGEDSTQDQRLLEAEQLRFNPWHALEQHRPLGSLNRARWSIYRASQARRDRQPLGAPSEPAVVPVVPATGPLPPPLAAAVAAPAAGPEPAAAWTALAGTVPAPPPGAAADRVGDDAE